MNRQYGALSGLAILLIVLNHAVHFGMQITPAEGVSFKLLVTLQALGVFAVPTFLFISGAFLVYAARQLTYTFVSGSLARILLPYVIWSIAFYMLVYAATDTRLSAAGHVKNLLVGYPYHFVPLLVFWYLAAPLIVKGGRRYPVPLVAAVFAYQAALVAIRMPSAFGLTAAPALLHAFRVPVLSTPLSDWGVYFPLGVALSLHAARLRPTLLSTRRVAAAATLGIFVLGLLNAFAVVKAPWARFLAPIPLMFLLPVIERGRIPFAAALEAIGRRSYGVYLSHFVAINVLVFALRGGPAGPHLRLPLLIPLLLVGSVLAPMLLMTAAARLPATRRVYRHVFGSVPPAPAFRTAQRGPGVAPGRAPSLTGR